jgi:hypothetical protein
MEARFLRWWLLSVYDLASLVVVQLVDLELV